MLNVYVRESDSLMMGRLKGTFDRKLALKLLEFIEIKEVENEKGFDRVCDLRGITRIQLGLGTVEAIAARRSAFNPNRIRVKSAFLVGNPLTYAIVGLYGALLKSPRLQVRTFSTVESAARWLSVTPRRLALP